MHEASFFKALQDEKVQCELCPHNCLINQDKRGVCRMRINKAGKLYSENYGIVSSKSFDPIEKKPLYNFYPGETIFSIGSIGCNLKCSFCQNHQISQCFVDEFSYLPKRTAVEVVEAAVAREDNIGIAYTYDEPTVWYEFMKDVAVRAKKKDLINVMVSNGFINPEPLKALMDVMDAFSIDLKAFSESFYSELTSSHLQPVLESLKIIREYDKHLEIVNLLIPGENDDEKEFINMLEWIRDKLGRKTVLHLSRYFPTYKLSNPPTPVDQLERFYDIAADYLDYVYLGNVRGNKGQNTYCHECGGLLIKRDAYYTSLMGFNDGRCDNCNTEYNEIICK